jgi:hypothetical protein
MHSQGTVLRKTAPAVGTGMDATFPGRVLSYMPFFWIGGLQSVAGSLQSGAAVLTLERLDPVAAVELARREHATSINGNATTLRALLGSATVLGAGGSQPASTAMGGPEKLQGR